MRDRRARDEVAAELREDDAFADGVGLVAAAADALQAARDRRRRLDLDDQIDRAHVDAEFERRGGDQRLKRARLEEVFDLAALRRARSTRGASARAVSPASSLSAPASRSARRRLLTKISVDWCARISSSSRGWIADQIEGRGSPTEAGPLGNVIRGGQPRHVLDRHFDSQRQRLLCSGIDDGHRPVNARRRRRRELVANFLFDRGFVSAWPLVTSGFGLTVSF